MDYLIPWDVHKVKPCCSTDPDFIKKSVQDWQTYLNLGILCPLTTCKTFSVGDGCLALDLEQRINNQIILEYIRMDMDSDWELMKNKLSTRYLYRHHVFNELWRGRILRENIPIRPRDRVEEPKNLPLVQTRVFEICKNRVVRVAADLFNYKLSEVKNMMHWHRIRREAEGFIDTKDRTLNFDGEVGYSQLNAVHIDLNSKEFSLLLTREDKEDNLPALFGWMDIGETFVNGICGGTLSFEEENVASRLDAWEKLNLPYFPFFKVEFEGIGVDGKRSKELLCGTNLLMTQYHTDLLVKMLSTGQEVSATFPFAWKDTRNGLLANLPEHLQKILTPVGQRKKAERIRAVEEIHRFWVQVGATEQHNEELSPGKMNIRFGDVVLELRVMRMMRDQNGKLIDAESLLDQEGPEVRFKKDFNENIDLIMEYFPVFRRLKELAKISLCFELLHNILKKFEDKPGFDSSLSRILDNFNLPTWRPYSQCVKGETCHCCDWVPAVFQEVAVTDEQKLDYLWRFKRGGAVGKGMAIDGGKKPMLCWEGAGAGPSTCNERSSSGPTKSTSSKKVEFSAKDFDLVERYGVYGGICFAPTSKIVQKLPPRSYNEKANLSSGTYLFEEKTQRFGFNDNRFGSYGKTGYRAAEASVEFLQAKFAKQKIKSSGVPGTSSGSSGNGNDDDNNNKKIKGQKLTSHTCGMFDKTKPIIFPTEKERTNHIFRTKGGHFTQAQNTDKTRKLLVDLVNEGNCRKNYLCSEIHGKTEKMLYGQILTEGPYKGQELWCYTQGNVIWDAGINKVPKYIEEHKIKCLSSVECEKVFN